MVWWLDERMAVRACRAPPPISPSANPPIKVQAQISPQAFLYRHRGCDKSEGYFRQNVSFGRMISIGLLVPEGAVAQGVADPRYLFQTVEFWRKQTEPDAAPRLSFATVGATPTVGLQDGAFRIEVDYLTSAAPAFDLLLVPPTFGDLDAAIARNAGLIEWMRERHAAGTELASLCLGAFLVASAGLLDGLACSTHWAFADELARRHPTVHYTPGRIVTFERGIYTSGGAHSYWALLLYLVERFYDRATSIRAAKYFGVDYGRQSQAHLSIFEGQRRHDDTLVHRVQDLLEARYAEGLSMDALSQNLHVTRRTLERRFRAATQFSPASYLQRVRVERSRQLLEQGGVSVDEVAERVGYRDRKSFSELFARQVSMTPLEYRRRYGA